MEGNFIQNAVGYMLAERKEFLTPITSKVSEGIKKGNWRYGRYTGDICFFHGIYLYRYEMPQFDDCCNFPFLSSLTIWLDKTNGADRDNHEFRIISSVNEFSGFFQIHPKTIAIEAYLGTFSGPMRGDTNEIILFKNADMQEDHYARALLAFERARWEVERAQLLQHIHRLEEQMGPHAQIHLLAIRHGVALWTDGENKPMKCSVVMPTTDNPFPVEIIDGLYVGKVYEFRGQQFGMLPPLITVNPLSWYEDFPPEYYLRKRGFIVEYGPGHFCVNRK